MTGPSTLASTIEEAERIRTTTFVTRASTALGITAGLYMVGLVAFAAPTRFELIGIGAFGASMVGLRALALRGRARLAGVLLVAAYTVAGAAIVVATGVGAVQAMNLVLCVVLAGLIVGRWATALATVVSIGAVFLSEGKSVETLAIASAIALAGLLSAWIIELYGVSIARVARVGTDLDERELQFAELVRHSPDGVLSLRATGEVESINPAVTAITGYDEGDLLGIPFWKLPFLTQETKDALGPRFKDVLLGRTIDDVRVPIRTKDGGLVHLTARPRLARRLDGTTAVHATVRDITAQVEMEQKQQALEERLETDRRLESLGRLAGGIAHDFNNMLTVILSGASELLRDETLRDRAELREISDAAERSADLTRRLLAFGRRQPSSSESMDLSEVVQGLEPMLRRLLRENIELEVVSSARDRFVLADQGHIQQVVMNLATNAADAMHDGGVLRIETRAVSEPEPSIVLSVRDTGVGIDPANVERIFEPFFSTKESEGGTGLGLATVYGIVQQCGGHIEVSSEPGQGTSFEITFPEAPATPHRSERETPVPDAGTHQSILLVEDDHDVRRSLERVLISLGHDVTTAESGDRALTLFDDGTPCSILLSDVVMPGMSGPKLVEALRERGYEGPAVLMSAYVQQDWPAEVADAFIAKPFTRTTLGNVLDQAFTERCG